MDGEALVIALHEEPSAVSDGSSGKVVCLSPVESVAKTTPALRPVRTRRPPAYLRDYVT